MNLLFCFKDVFCRILARRRTIAVLLCGYLVCLILGIVFVKTPAMYGYHLRVVDRFLDRVCYSDSGAFGILFERLFGYFLMLFLLTGAGVHVAAVWIAPLGLCFRAYTFGGSVAIFFSVYRATGGFVALLLYAPVHLAADFIFLCICVLSLGRCVCFDFSKRCLCELFVDFCVGLCCLFIVCLLEILFLFCFFRILVV